MFDISALREALQRGDITDVGWLRSGHNLADELTNPGKCAQLESFLEQRKFPLHVAQWVVRSKT